MTINNPKYDKQTAIFTELCSIIEEDSQSVYDVLDAIVAVCIPNKPYIPPSPKVFDM